MSHLYITDLDGTLLNDSTEVSPESAAIISDLSARGALITVATARTPATVEKLLCDTDIRIPAIVMTGASMWDRQKRRYVNPRLISPDKASSAIEVFIRNGLQPFVYTISGELLEVFHHGPLTPEEQTFVDLRKDLDLKKFYLDSTERRVREAENVILIFGMGNEPQLGEIARKLEDEGGYSISFYEDNASPQYYIEVFAEGVSKASAVTSLASRVGADGITVYGDNLNDLSMMAVADDSVAVSNAKPEVLAQASRSIGSNNSDAVAKDMKEQFEKTAPVVSVLIITYNQHDTISRAIDSVLEQETDYPYEILIGDDGSTDGTRRICEEYASRYPNLIRLMPEAPNKGMLRNYFDTLAAARGKYIADCAGDDCWCDPRKIDMMTEILEKNPDVTAVFSDARLVYESDPSRNVTTDSNPSVARWRD
ncbi:MAG: HAD-IIB family hydrolase, partial [Muribaculaceae bacterium]|nr:HAD-IIB family hydrolase [Muribaculaceae bacterium]